MKAVLLLSLLTCCGYFDTVKPVTKAQQDEAMRQAYEDRLGTAQGYSDGWPSKTDCDGLVWASEASMGGVYVDLSLANENGRFYRRPSKDCYQTGDSRSSISNDGMVMVMVALFMKDDQKSLKQMISYGEQHGWVYGSELESYLKPWWRKLLYTLAGEESKIPFILTYSKEDYVAHIQSVGMWAYTQATGGLSSNNVDLLARYHKRDPGDYLIRSIYGLFNPDINSPFTEIEPPSYVRGSAARRFALVHWLLAAKIYLDL